ncbi:MAG: MarR family winged helix-turn-helix transcriptional regulator [Eubacterium sp.]
MHDFWSTAIAIKKYYLASLQPVMDQYRLKRSELDILLFIRHNPDCNTAQEISNIRGIAKSQVSSSLKRLEKSGLVTRHPDKKDRRSIRLFLTEEASEIITSGEAAQLRFFDKLKDGFSEEETAELRHMINRISENAECGLSEILKNKE